MVLPLALTLEVGAALPDSAGVVSLLQAKRQYSGIYATILAFFIYWQLMVAILI